MTKDEQSAIENCPHKEFNGGTLQCCESGCGHPRLYIQGYLTALEHERGKWTAVDGEDYPDELRTVWITFRHEFAKRSSVATAFYDDEQWFWTGVDDGGDAIPVPHVVLAWMPYVEPEPYAAPGKENTDES